GGPGIPPAEAWAMMFVLGDAAAPVPAAETMLARGLVAQAGVRPPDGILTIASAVSPVGLHLHDGAISGRLARVPHGARAQAVLAIIENEGGPLLVLVDPAL